MKPRKLLAADVLECMWLRYSIGVPICKLHRDATLNMSIPVFTALITHYEDSIDVEQAASITDTIRSSLFPEWLKDDSKLVQIQPQDWRYVGRFPLGQWLRINEDN